MKRTQQLGGGKNRLDEMYKSTIRPQLQEKLQLNNIMEVPKISKIVLNVGVKEAVNDSKALQNAEQVLRAIAGQAPVRTKARKSIAGFKIREGMQIGVMVTLRGENMYAFLDKLINVSLPKCAISKVFQPNWMVVAVIIWALKTGAYSLRLKEQELLKNLQV